MGSRLVPEKAEEVEKAQNKAQIGEEEEAAEASRLRDLMIEKTSTYVRSLHVIIPSP